MSQTIATLDAGNFYSSELSDNLSRTPEEYLICHNVRVARIGKQIYLGEEIGQPDYYGKEVNVYRLPQDVFEDETLASMEGKPVTDDHPASGVNAGNYGIHLKGHAQNARREGDYIVCDLIVMDPVLISKILDSGKRQVSVGYDCNYEPYKDGFRQFNIRGNHIAVVEKGRAGPKVSITDSLNQSKKGDYFPMNRKQVLAKMLAVYARDASPAELEQALLMLDEEKKEEPKEDKEKGMFDKFKDWMKSHDESKEEKEEKGEDKKSKDKKKSMDERMAELEDSMKRLHDKKHKDAESEGELEEEEEGDKDLLEELLEREEHEEEEEEKEEKDSKRSKDKKSKDKKAKDEESKEEKEEKGEDKKAHDAALRTVILAMKPVIAKMSAKDQRAIKDALAETLGRTSSGSSYAGIKAASNSHTKTSDGLKGDPAELGKWIQEQFNPHLAKEAKKFNYIK